MNPDPVKTASTFGVRRFVLEALSVTAGILLAFAIDAWWSEVEQDRTVAGLRAAAAAEAETNRQQLELALDWGERSLASSQHLVQLIRPAPEPIPADSLGRLLGASFLLDAALLELSATDRLLRAGDVDALGNPEFHSRLQRYRSTARRYSDYGQKFAEVRERVIEEMARIGPSGFLSAAKGVHEPSDFDVPVVEILSDPGLEAAIGNLAVWADNLNVGARVLRARLDSAWASEEASR